MKTLLLIAAVVARAASPAADSARGAKLFETLACVQCHSVNGVGGTIAPDLGRIVNRNFTPSTVASTMWNHAPTMWAAMRDRDIRIGDLNEQAAADLFAFFYSARFFERSGDAGRGKRAFEIKHCAECHQLSAVAKWESTGNPMAMVNAMWNHAGTMKAEFAKRKLAYPEITAQNLSDILVYLRNLPGARAASGGLEITSGDSGKVLFESKGCAACHVGKLALPARLKGMTLTDIAVAMWNHAPRMSANLQGLGSPERAAKRGPDNRTDNLPGQASALPAMTLSEMTDITSFLWAGQFFADAGDATAGRRVFTAKRCASCHNDASSGAPKIVGSDRTFSGAAMVAALWHHGPRMLDQMANRDLVWPRFDAREMSNLIAYLNRKGAKQ